NTDPPGHAVKTASQCPGASGTEAGDPGAAAGKAESKRPGKAPQTGKRVFCEKLNISREIQAFQPGSSRDIFLVRSSFLFQVFSNPEDRDQKEDQCSCRHPEEGNVHSMDQGSVSVCSCRAFTYYCHNAYEHRGAHRSCDGSEGSQHRSEEHTSELQSRFDLVCRLLLEKKNISIFRYLQQFSIILIVV